MLLAIAPAFLLVHQATLPALTIKAPASVLRHEKQVRQEYTRICPQLFRLLDIQTTQTVAITLTPDSTGLALTRAGATLGIRHGGFPRKRYAFDEQLAEAIIAQVAPNLDEPLWGHGLTLYVATEALRRSGFEAEAKLDQNRRYVAALKYDPRFGHADVTQPGGLPHVLLEGKGLWLLKQLETRYASDFIVHYFRSKRRLAPPGKPFTADDAAAIASDAAGFQQFDWLRAHGVMVDQAKTQIGKQPN